MAVISSLKALPTPTAATQAKQLNLNGPMGNSGDMVQNAILQAQELQGKLKLCLAMTDAADPNNAALTTIIATLA